MSQRWPCLQARRHAPASPRQPLGRRFYAPLRAAGIRVGLVHGGVPDEERTTLRQRFESQRDDPEAVDVLLFSEVGCERIRKFDRCCYVIGELFLVEGADSTANGSDGLRETILTWRLPSMVSALTKTETRNY